MHALLSLPAPVLPNAFLIEVPCISILGAVLALVAIFPSLRKRQFSAILLLIGVIEFLSLAQPMYTVPVELFIISFVTIISGIIIPIFYTIRHFINKNKVKLFLVFSGCVELALGAINLLYIRYWEFPELYLTALLGTISIYSLVIGTFLLVNKPKAK